MAAMSVNDVLNKFFRLPKPVMMMLALLGFGSLATLLFKLVPGIRTPKGMIAIAVIFGVGLLLFGIIYLIRRVRGGRQASKLSDALTASTGPTVGDLAEQQRIHREKFRAKLNDLRANGLSVYKLPWFVLIGEPGCGKSASLIHSGIDFPLGRDEVPGFGGTRNYNWWFTNDAVILDTAGRLSFQEEGTTDKAEWEYFLKLLKGNRPRCPINGVIIALPADRLVTDSSEERAQKAAILRDRMRQIQQGLGVRFPTFVLVTKMDRIGGFAEFFEEMRVDLAQRKQMFGWSRPGDFATPYDPTAFPTAFDEVHRRLRSWSLRYLQRKATDQELGLVVTFPEAFRELRTPLDDYVSTIFQKSPLVEPPFFRGFYFSSAVQEGAPIFHVFSKMHHGAPLRERSAPKVQSMSFFIHDFYARKVFPEHGLVFRSAKHASLNKRMRRNVMAGSLALVTLMLTFFVFGTIQSRELIDKPREKARLAASEIGEINSGKETIDLKTLPTKIETAKAIWSQYETYNTSWAPIYARMLWIGANTSVPAESIRQIHARYVIECIGKPVVSEAGRRLATSQVPGQADEKTRERYMGALSAYAAWYGEQVGVAARPALAQAEAKPRRQQFAALLDICELSAADSEAAAEQFELAVGSLGDDKKYTRSFARDVLESKSGLGFDAAAATQTLAAAAGKLADSWRPLTLSTAESGNKEIRYWAELGERVGRLRERYDELLKLGPAFLSPAQMLEAAAKFKTLTAGVDKLADPQYLTAEGGSLHEAMVDLMKFLSEKGVEVPQDEKTRRILRFKDLAARLAGRWETDFKRLEDALSGGEAAVDRTKKPRADVYVAIDGGKQDLSRLLGASLQTIRERLGADANQTDFEPVTYYAELKLIDPIESTDAQPLSGKASLKLAADPLGLNNIVRTYLVNLIDKLPDNEKLLGELADLRNWANRVKESTSAVPLGDKPLDAWLKAAPKDRTPSALEDIVKKSGFSDRKFWQPQRMFDLAEQMDKARRQSQSVFVLKTVETRCSESLSPPVEAAESFRAIAGIAKYMPDAARAADALPFDWHEFNRPGAERPIEGEKPAEKPVDEPADPFAVGGAPKPASKPADGAAPKADVGTLLLLNYHRREFLRDVLREHERVLAALAELEKHAKDGGPAMAELLAQIAPTREALNQSANRYVDGFFNDWFLVYSRPAMALDSETLALIDKCQRGKISFAEFVAQATAEKIAEPLQARLAALIREAVLTARVLEQGDQSIGMRLRDRNQELRGRGRSLILGPLAGVANRAGRIQGGPPEEIISEKLVSAWREYLRSAATLQDLSKPQAAGATLPDLDLLKKNIVLEEVTTLDNTFIAPLVDIAQHGQMLLFHRLDGELFRVFEKANGKFPVVETAAARVEADDYEYRKLSTMARLSGDEFLALLREVGQIDRRFGKLYEASATTAGGPAAAWKIIQKCREWAAFLYDDPKDLLDPALRPRRLPTRIALSTLDGVQVPGNIYLKVRLALPLYKEGAPMQLEEFNATTDTDVQSGDPRSALTKMRDFKYDFDLMAGEAFVGTTAGVGKLIQGATGPDPSTAFELPGTPWMILMLLASDEKNELEKGSWVIPVRMKIQGQATPLGFRIALQFGGVQGQALRQFPGVVTPFAGPSKDLPKMPADRAERYLKLN